MFKFWNYYVLKLLRDATLSDINVVLYYVLSQCRYCYKRFLSHFKGSSSQDQQTTNRRRIITSKVTLTLDLLIFLTPYGEFADFCAETQT
jgi:hypothetical protein